MAPQTFNLFLGLILFHIICVLGSNCNWHYYKHYEQKGCSPVLGDDGCPVRFQCKKLSSEDLRTCVHDGKIYREGEEISGIGPCDSCTCDVDPSDGMAYIECASVDCPQWEPENKACYMGYKPRDCCPTEMCPAGDKDAGKACKYNGKEYDIGRFIEIPNPCQTCICTENWTGLGGPGCSPVNCLTGIYAKEIRKGCLPIYSSTGCCAFDMYCDKLYGATPVSVAKDEVKDNYCSYQGAYFRRGTTTHLKTNRHQCITCTCATPPDFTCLKTPCS